MSFYEENLKAIEVIHQDFYRKLQQCTLSREYNKLDNIELLDTKDGNSSVCITFREHTYRFNSRYYPLMEAKKWAEQFNMRNIDMVISMFGLGNGFFARELLKRLKDTDLLFIYEPCQEIFDYMLKHYDMIDLLGSSNVFIFVEEVNENDFKHMISRHVNWVNVNSQLICIHPQYDLVFTESVGTFRKLLSDNNNYIMVNQNSNAALSKIITENTLTNFKFLKNCNIVTDLKNKFSPDIPAIIVAAGPSLDKNIDELKCAKGRAVIFAVDTAVKYLLKHDIEPDFIVTLDPKKSMHHLADKRCSDIPMFSRIEARTENLERNNKKIIFYNIEGYSKRLLVLLGKDTGILNSGGSVATGAFSICKTLEFKKIILVGLDLAYSGTSTHAGGISVDADGAGRFLEQVEDISGNSITTRYDWYIYIKWFEEAIELINNSEVIDATEGGARIKGTVILPLKEAIRRYCNVEVDCDKIVTELEPMLNTQGLSILKECIQKDMGELKEIKELASSGKKTCEKLIVKYKESLIETNASILKNKQLSHINNLIEQKEIYELIDWDIAEDTFKYLSDLYVYTDNKENNKLSTYQKALNIYEAIIKAADRILPMLEKAKEYFI